MPDIDCPSHMMPSRPAIDSESVEDDEGTNDNRTLAEVIEGKKTKTPQEGQSSPGGDPLPNHPKGPRAATGSAGLVLHQVALKMRHPGERSSSTVLVFLVAFS
jgi:hypothetical protein